MKAGVYRGSRRIVVEDVPEPELGPGELRLEISACGICGSDLHTYTEGWLPVGTVMGHEFSGVVLEVGEGADASLLGERIAICGIVGCGECGNCRAGATNLCPDKRRAARGAFAERYVTPPNPPVYRLPDHVTPAHAAMIEPLATSLNAVRQGAPRLDEPIVVVGLGSIGLGVVTCLEALGATNVIGVDLSPLRLEHARAQGAEVVIDAREQDVVEAVSAITGRSRQVGYEFALADTVFDCSGVSRLVGTETAELVRAGGTVVVVSLFEQPVTLDLNAVVRKQAHVVGSWAYSYAVYDEAVEMICSGRVDPTPMITHRFPLAEIDAAFALQLDKDASVKVLIEP